MKKFLAFTLILVLMVAAFPFSAFAEEQSSAASNNAEVLYLDNGNYIEITRAEYTTRASGNKTGTVTYTCKTGDTTLWVATLTASYTYTGTSATCTNAALNTSMYESSYYEASRSVSRSGNTATADFTIGHKFLGVTVSTDSYTLTLSCDANGNLS